MADNTPKRDKQDEQPIKDQPQTGGKDMEEAQEEAAEEREEEGGYQ